ncbi:MAG TPA: AraC family transcriptional regulator [Bryobacteraceae bacterium]|jgi:AraC family transcriptional regulator
MTRASTLEDYRERMVRALVHIQSHLDDPLLLDDLAAVANFSPYHFHRIFTGMVGESVKEHVRRLRMERAAQRLRQSEAPVTDIAFDAGYEAHESFTRAFRARFGMSPSDFREALSRSDARPPGIPSLDVRIERIDGTRVAFIRHVGAYGDVGSAWMRLINWAWPQGLLGPNAAFLGICHDDPEITEPAKLRYDAAIPVPPSVEPRGEIGIQTLEAGEYASAVHQGPYTGLGATYARMCGEWLPSSGRELRSAPALEFYLNSPQSVPPTELLTRVSMPLAE